MRPSITTIIAFAALAGLIHVLIVAGIDVLFSDPIEWEKSIQQGRILVTGWIFGALLVKHVRRNG